MADGKPKLSWKRSLIPLALIATGIILTTLQLLVNAGSYIQSWFVQVDHPVSWRFILWGELLRAHVKGDFVDYRELMRNSGQLNQAVEELKQISPDRLANKDEQLCFWINAYNLLVVKNIADHYPLSNVRALEQEFSLKSFVVGGKPYSAEQIAMAEIRPRIARGDIRAVFTVCGGSQGYPPLLGHPLEAARLTDDMNAACFRFVNNPNNVYLDEDTDTLILSPFFKWNAGLLNRDYRSPFAFANEFLTPDRKVNLESIHIKRSYYSAFNWWLNDTALKDRQRRSQNVQQSQENSDLAPDALPDQNL